MRDSHKMPEQHRDFLLKAVRLAADHMRANEGGPFGAVVVKDGNVIAEGFNKVTSKYEGMWIDTASTILQTESGDVTVEKMK